MTMDEPPIITTQTMKEKTAAINDKKATFSSAVKLKPSRWHTKGKTEHELFSLSCT
jgi:hypothetical protein